MDFKIPRLSLFSLLSVSFVVFCLFLLMVIIFITLSVCLLPAAICGLYAILSIRTVGSRSAASFVNSVRMRNIRNVFLKSARLL